MSVHLYPFRPVARLFYGEVRSKKEADQMRPEEQLSRKGGRALVVWDWIARQVYNWGRGVVDFERVNVSHLGASWGMLPRKILILSPPKWLEMHLKLTWWGETYILSTDKRSRHKKNFLHKELCSFNRSFNILQATQRAGSSMSKLTGILIPADC